MWIEDFREFINNCENKESESKFDHILEKTLEYEGGYVNHPNDPGGATNKGITQDTYDRYIESIRNVRDIPDCLVNKIYEDLYYKKIKLPVMGFKTSLAMFDFAVHSGVSKASITLQRIINDRGDFNPRIAEDGIIGQETQKEFEKVYENDESMALEIIRRRRNFLNELCENNSKLRTFKEGWNNRIEDIIKEVKNYG